MFYLPIIVVSLDGRFLIFDAHKGIRERLGTNTYPERVSLYFLFIKSPLNFRDILVIII